MAQYQAWSVTYNETPNAAKWNILGTNDVYFQNTIPPVGSLLYYWGNSASVPGYYLLANGQTVSDAESPIDGLVLPNLVNKFVRGTTGNVRTAPVSGGADSYAMPAHHHQMFYTGVNGGDWFDSSNTQIMAGSPTGTHSGASPVSYWTTLGSANYYTEDKTAGTVPTIPAYVGLVPIIRYK